MTFLQKKKNNLHLPPNIPLKLECCQLKMQGMDIRRRAFQPIGELFGEEWKWPCCPECGSPIPERQLLVLAPEVNEDKIKAFCLEQRPLLE